MDRLLGGEVLLEIVNHKTFFLFLRVLVFVGKVFAAGVLLFLVILDSNECLMTF